MATALRAERKKDPPYISLRAAAARLGISAAQLSRAGRHSELYAPAVRGLGLTFLGRRTVRFHVEQLRIIEQVMLGLFSVVEGELRWAAFRSNKGREAR